MAARGEDFRVPVAYGRSRFARHLWKTTALSTLALALSGVAAYGEDALWQPQIRAIIGADNNGGNAALEGFIPIKQTAESVLFLDVRAKHDFKDAFGQDVGLGIRRIVNPDLMLGGYAYLNVENYNSNQFTSATLGAEAITPHFDAHVNVFVPIKGDTTDHSVSSTLSMVSNQLIEQISVLDHRDYAAWGIEGEVGARVPLNLPDKHSLRLDIGGYHFEDPHGDDRGVTGVKAGIEYEIGDVFGTGTALTFTGEVRNDNRDDTQFAGSVRLSIPFNPGQGGADSGPEPVYPVSEGLRKRVNERVRGDIGVRIQSQDLPGGSTTRVAINAATNAAFGKFYYADGGLAGAGTLADPTTLDDAVTKAGAGGFVVALGGNGNITTTGTTLADGQTVIGGGQSVTAKLFGGGTGTFNLGGSDGTIQGTNVANNVITLGNGDTLNGITITGGADGIFGNNITGATLTNVTVTGGGGNGAAFTGTSTGITGSNFTATGNGLDGLHIEGDGTYNFAGTTLLQGNGDDGLDASGHGTYTFATLNAKDNADRGITVQGTSTSGSFTTIGGTVSGNGGVGVFMDPITAHVVLDSITQSGGTSGVVLDQVAGSFTVNGSTTVSNTSGPAIAISDSPAAIRFGDIDISAPAGDGISFAGVNAAVVAGNIVISGLGVGTGLDFSGSHTNFTARSLNIAGTSAAGSIGIDLASPSSGGATIVITDGGVITGVDTGVRFGMAGSLANSANAEFSFGGGSISGITASLDARGLNQTLGHYAFGSTTFSGPQLFDQQNVIFVGAAATGSGTGSSLLDLASIATADANTDGSAIFVLVNRGTIDDADGFSLSAGQTLASFGNGRTFSLGGLPVNVTGDNVEHASAVSDAAGAAMLTSSAGADTVTLANNTSLLDFNLSNANPGGNGIHGNNVTGVTIGGVNVSGAGLNGLLFEGASNVSANNLTSTGNVGDGLHIDGDGTYAFNGTTGLSGNGGSGLSITGDGNYAFQTLNASDNFDFGVNVLSAAGTFSTTGGAISGNGGGGVAMFGANLDVTLTSLTQDGGLFGAILIGVSGNFAVSGATTVSNASLGGLGIFDSTADFTFGAVDISDITGVGIDLQNSGGAVTFGGPVTLTHIDNQGILATGSAGTITFSGPVNMSDPGDGIWLENNTGAVSFSGAVTIDQPFDSGIDVVGTNGNISFDDIDITGLCNCSTALDLSGSTSTFTATTLDISGSSGGSSIGIDLSGTNGGSVSIGGGVITGVDTGVQMGTNGLAGSTANTAFSFGAAGGASISGVIASLDMRGLLAGSGTYALNGTHLVGPQLFDTADVVFVGSTSTGTGDGSSVANLIDAAAADDLTTNANTTFVLVKTAAVQTTDTDADGFTLASGQSLVSFANGAIISLGGPPANVTGAEVVTGATMSDPTGFGGATLNNGAGNTIDLASGNTVSNLSVNSSFLAIDGTASINGLTSTGVTILGGVIGLYLGSASGAITVNDLTIQGSVPNGVVLANTSATVDFTGTTTIAGGSNIALLVNNFGGTANFADLDISGGSGLGIAILNGSSGSLTFGAASSIANTGGGAIVIGSSSADVAYDGTISQSSAAKAVRIDGTTGGLITFGGSITSTGTGGLFDIGETIAPTDTAIRFMGPLTATGGGGASITGLGGGSTFEVSSTLSITGATGDGLSIASVTSTASAAFGAVTITGAGGNGIDISGNAGQVSFGTTNVTMGAAANMAGINFSGTNNNVNFGTTTVSGLGAGANQKAIDFAGSATTAGFGLTTITGNDDASSRGIDLSSTTGNRTITFLTGSSISGAGIGVDLSSGQTTATSANANFTFGDGEFADANGRNSTITAAAGNFTVNTVGLAATGNYDFDDVAFTGNANLASAVGGVIMVSQTGGVINAGTNGLSAAVTTVTVAQADAIVGTQTFAFVGTVDLSGTPFTLDSGQSITGFGNGNAITTTGTIQPVNVQGNLGATGGDVTGDAGVVRSTGSDTLHLLGSNQVRNTDFDFTGGSGSVFTIDQSAGSFNNAGGIVIEGVKISNVAAGQTAFKVAGLDTNLSITNNNVNVAGTLLDVNGGAGNITVTRGTLPNGGPAGTLTGGGISIANHGGNLINFTDKVTVGGNGVSLTSNLGTTINFTDVGISTNGATAFSATGGGTINVLTGTVNATNAQAVALDGITGNIDFASTSATFGSGSGIDLQNLGGTFNFGTGTLTNTGSGTAFNVGSATNASGGNANISYAGAIVSNGTGAAVSIQELTGGSVTLSGNLTDAVNTSAGGNVVVAGIDNGTAATVTFSGTTKQISSGATDGVNLGLLGNFPTGTPAPNTNGTINFTQGGLAITTTDGTGFVAGYGGTVSVSGAGNTIAASNGNGLVVSFADVGSDGVTFDSISAKSNSDGAGVFLWGSVLAGDVDIGGLRDTGYTGASLFGLSGTGEVNFTGTTDLDVSYTGFDIGGPQVGTINIANVAGSALTIDGGQFGIRQSSQGGTINVGVNGSASITNTTLAALSLGGGNDLAFTTLTYNGSITIGAGAVLSASGDGTRLNMSGSVNSTTSSTAFDFFGHADGIYDISSTIDHSGGKGVAIGGSANGTVTFSGTSKKFDTGANDAIVKAPVYVMDPQTKGTLAFTNGGLVITTTSGAGFIASTTGSGTVTVSGSGNTITTTTGTALKLDGASVGAGGITFGSVSANGAATGVSLNNVSGGGLDLGAVDLEGITSRGVDISGTLGSTLDFDSLKIGLNAPSAIGLDLNGASLGASTITAGDFDVDGGSFAGTIGIDMAGTTGTGTIQLGDAANNNPAGQTSTIGNVGYGVQFSSATNARLVFGDGAGLAESTIATTGGQVIHATDTLPTNGDYNFNDVNFTGDISNLSSFNIYYVVEGGTGDGSLANPGSYASAQTSTANVIVLIDKSVDGSQSTIDMSGTTFDLDDGQVLLAFKDNDAAIDVSQLGVDTSSGASAAFHFTTVQNSPIISAPAGIDTLRPILQSNNATSVIDLATSGSGIFTGGIQNLIIRNTGTGAGIFGNASAASSFFLRNNDITAGGNALDFSATGAAANTLLLSIDGNTLASTGSALAGSFVGQNIDPDLNSIAIRSFANNKVTGGTGGGIAFTNVRFDSDGAGGFVSAGTLDIGTTGARVQGNGLSLTGTSGTLDLGTFTVANNGGTGVLVDTKGPPATTFTLNSSGGTVDTTNGAAFNLDPLTVNLTVASVTATGGASGVIFDGVTGTFTVTGATTITGTTGAGISSSASNLAGTFNFNTLTVNNTASTGGGIGWESGTLNIGGLANIDTASGAGLFQGGGTTSFSGGLTIDTTTATGISGPGGTINILATAGSETVNSTSGQAINLTNAALDIALDSTSSGGGGSGVVLVNATGAASLGTGTLSGGSGTAFSVDGGTVSTTYGGDITQTSNAALVSVSSGHTGTLTFTGTLSATNGTGLQFLDADGSYNFNGTTTLNGGAAAINIISNSGGTFNFGTGTSITSPNSTAFNVDTSAANVTYSGNITQGGNLALVAITGHTTGTITFQTGTLSATNGTGLQFDNADGTYNFNGTTTLAGGDAGVDITTGSGGTFGFGTGTSITNPSGVGFLVNGGTSNVTYNGTVGKTLAGKIVDISGVTGGAITLAGNLTASGDLDNGIFVHSNTGGTFTFSGATKTLTTGTNTAVDLATNTGATINFSNGGLAITTTGGIGFSATGGGTVSVTGSGNTISTGSGAAVNMDTVAVGAGGMTFASTNTSAGSGSAVILDTVTGGTVNFGGGALVGGGSATIRIGDGAGSANTGGTAAFAYAGTITSGTGRAIDIQDRAAGAGNITLSGNISHNVAGQTGILLDDNAAGIITFSGASKSITSGSATAVNLTDNAGATINFTNGGLVISTTSGIGFNATGAGPAATTGGTVTVQGTGNTISSPTGTALNVVNATIGASGLVFRNISSTGSSGNAGIVLDNTGTSGGLTVTGTGTAGTGGTISNKTGADILTGSDASGQTTSGTNGTGIFLRNAVNVSLTNMQLNDFTNFAVYGNTVTNFTMTGMTISGVNGNSNAGNVEESAVRFDNLLGSASITGSKISGGAYGNLAVWNTSGTLNRLTMSGNTFGLISSTLGNDNVDFTVYNNATANVTLDNNTFSGTRSDFFEAIANNNAIMDVVATNNTFHNGQTIIPGGGIAISVRSGSGGNTSAATTTFNIANNIDTDGGTNAFGTVGIFVAKGQDLGTVTGKITGNQLVGQPGSNSDGIFVRAAGASGTLTTLIQNNTITGWGNAGIHLQNNDGSATMNASVFGNSVTAAGVAFPYSAFFADNGATATDTGTMNLVLGGTSAGQQNTFTGGAGAVADVSLGNLATTTLNLSRNGSVAGTADGVVQDDNVGTPTVNIISSPVTLVGTLPPTPP
ncbi:beta strand repeat-containing protein [Mesorhizobium sp. BR1-1-2]|uniref:beta strand repeat-containing protein n=1 Tax=Mesorhizobium sp. BR1-1-2 TaxID=2876652 RepID=UPI001CC979DE|nr:hypothetical protein [Mesorhizobium sp. BR1-1-2]MBZ9963721.1 hypothetical protein [Mesorhizobium sp. BR1-1-2]